MMAITTSNSTKVKPEVRTRDEYIEMILKIDGTTENDKIAAKGWQSPRK